jgi:hypothetical protein
MKHQGVRLGRVLPGGRPGEGVWAAGLAAVLSVRANVLCQSRLVRCGDGQWGIGAGPHEASIG